jgi:hypothetical protein
MIGDVLREAGNRQSLGTPIDPRFGEEVEHRYGTDGVEVDGHATEAAHNILDFDFEFVPKRHSIGSWQDAEYP